MTKFGSFSKLNSFTAWASIAAPLILLLSCGYRNGFDVSNTLQTGRLTDGNPVLLRSANPSEDHKEELQTKVSFEVPILEIKEDTKLVKFTVTMKTGSQRETINLQGKLEENYSADLAPTAEFKSSKNFGGNFKCFPKSLGDAKNLCHQAGLELYYMINEKYYVRQFNFVVGADAENISSDHTDIKQIKIEEILDDESPSPKPKFDSSHDHDHGNLGEVRIILPPPSVNLLDRLAGYPSGSGSVLAEAGVGGHNPVTQHDSKPRAQSLDRRANQPATNNSTCTPLPKEELLKFHQIPSRHPEKLTDPDLIQYLYPKLEFNFTDGGRSYKNWGKGTRTGGEIQCGGTELPQNGLAYSRYFTNDKNFGSGFLIKFIYDFTQIFNQANPECGIFSIGNLSKKRGGLLEFDTPEKRSDGTRQSFHASHQNGLEVDVKYFKNSNKFNVECNAKLFLFLSSIEMPDDRPAVNRIFVDSRMKSVLTNFYKKDSNKLNELEKLTLEKTLSFDRSGDHADHFHLRLACPSTYHGCVEM